MYVPLTGEDWYDFIHVLVTLEWNMGFGHCRKVSIHRREDRRSSVSCLGIMQRSKIEEYVYTRTAVGGENYGERGLCFEDNEAVPVQCKCFEMLLKQRDPFNSQNNRSKLKSTRKTKVTAQSRYVQCIREWVIVSGFLIGKEESKRT